jgi:hypothetical protein
VITLSSVVRPTDCLQNILISGRLAWNRQRLKKKEKNMAASGLKVKEITLYD